MAPDKPFKNISQYPAIKHLTYAQFFLANWEETLRSAITKLNYVQQLYKQNTQGAKISLLDTDAELTAK
jgi:hypothetical protein